MRNYSLQLFWRFFPTIDGNILYFPQANPFVIAFPLFFVLWPWLWERCNFMLVSLSLIFADSYVYPNVIVCDYKQHNIFAIPVLYPKNSGDLCSGVFFLVLWGQGPDPAALTAVLCDYTTCSLRITCRLCWILSVGKIEQFFAISFTPLKYWCFCLCLHLFVSFLLLVNFGPIVPLFRLG